MLRCPRTHGGRASVPLGRSVSTVWTVGMHRRRFHGRPRTSVRGLLSRRVALLMRPAVVQGFEWLQRWAWAGFADGPVPCGHDWGPQRLTGVRAAGPGAPAASLPYVAQAGSAVAACSDSVQPGLREEAGAWEGCPWSVTGSVPPTGMRARPPRPGEDGLTAPAGHGRV